MRVLTELFDQVPSDSPQSRQVFFPQDFGNMAHTHKIGNYYYYVKNWGKNA